MKLENWERFKMFIAMDFSLRYGGSWLGFVWVFLKPFLIFLVLLVVFSFFGSDIEHFQLYLLLGIILYQFFADGTSFGMHGLLHKAHVILKIPFDKTPVIFASVGSAVIHLFFAMVIFMIFSWWQGVFPSFENILLFLVLLFSQGLIILGISFFTSLWIISFRDLGQIWEVFLAALFYLTPIFYPLSLLSDEIRKILWLNPLTQIIFFGRNLMIYNQTVSWENLGILLLIGSVFFGCGYGYFRRNAQKILENV